MKSKFIKIFKVLIFIAVLLLCWILYIQWNNNTKINELKDLISNNEDRINDLEKENLQLTIDYESKSNNEFRTLSSTLYDLERKYESESEFQFLRTEEEKEITLRGIRNDYEETKQKFNAVCEQMKAIQEKQHKNIEEIETLKKEIEEYQDKIRKLK